MNHGQLEQQSHKNKTEQNKIKQKTSCSKADLGLIFIKTWKMQRVRILQFFFIVLNKTSLSQVGKNMVQLYTASNLDHVGRGKQKGFHMHITIFSLVRTEDLPGWYS